MSTKTTTLAIGIVPMAKICHETNKAYCEAIGDYSQKHWEETSEDIRQSAIKGVQFRLANPDASQSAQHESWMKNKVEEGWKYGPTKNAETKEHPCLVEYELLPEEDRRKDALFQAVIDAMIVKENAPVAEG